MKISRECLTGLPAGTAELGLRSLPNRLVTRRTNGLLEERLRFEALLMFEPLFTTKAEGLDICLAIVRTIVDARGGGLGAANNQQGGAAAHFTLPAGCGIGSWGGQRPSMGDYVTGMGPRTGRPPPEGANVALPRYAPALPEGGNVEVAHGPYTLGDTRAVMIEGPSREALELVEVAPARQ